jgi:hypothetical protein
MGRIVGITSCLVGVFIVSLFVVTLINLIEFKKNEKRSYDILLKLRAKGKVLFSSYSHSTNLKSYIMHASISYLETLKMKAISVLKSA